MFRFKATCLIVVVLAFLAISCGGQDTNVTPTDIPARSDPTIASPIVAPTATVSPTPTPVPPTASFSVDVETGSAPLIANFSNLSQGSITSVEWDFGDGTTSSDESPSHRYVISGTFDVQLTVSGPGGNDKSVMSDLIDIKPGPVVSLEVSPPDSALSVQESVQFTAMARDEFGNAVPSAFDWVTDQDGGSITENGLFTAGRETGIFTDIVSVSLQGSSGELTRKSSVTVTPGAVSRVVVEPPSVTLGVDDIRSFSFKSFDAFDNETTDVIVNWKVPPEVGTIGANGLFTAGTVAGRFNGALSLEAVGGTARASASVDVIILPDILATIEVKPANVFVNGGANQQFTAAGLDQYSNEIPQLAYIWESSGGDLTNAGLFTALGTGGIYEVVARATSKDGVTSGSARVEIPPSFSNFSDMSNINLIGDAEKGNGDVLRFPAKPSPWEEEMGMVGAAWFTGKQLVRDSFETTFEFQITELSSGGGAGFAFVIQNTDPAAIGLGGDAIGYQRIRNNIAVEFDTDRNDWTSDPDGNHISVHTRGTAGNLAQETYSIGVVSPNISMSDGKIHAVKIEYAPGTLSIYLDDLSSSLLQISLDIADTLALDDGKAWVGFTGSSNGPVSQNHDILSWTFTPVIVAS